MNHYETFKLEFITSLPDIPQDILDQVLHTLDLTAQSYSIEKSTTDIIVANEPFPQVLKLFLAAKAIEGLSPKTLNIYSLTIKNFLNAVNKPFNNITTNDIRIYLFNYKQTHNIKNSTQETMRIIITNFFEWCVREELLTKNPARSIHPIKTESKPRSALTPIELEYIRRACKTSREKALIDFLYSTGCRVSEVCGARVDDIDWVNKRVLIRHGKGNKTRWTYLNAECIVSLKAYLNTRTTANEYVFIAERKPSTSPLTPKTIQSIIQKIIGRVTDPLHCHVTPHVFRHTAATTALHNGMPIEQVRNFLGHSNINTTMIYAKVDSEDVKNSHSKYLN